MLFSVPFIFLGCRHYKRRHGALKPIALKTRIGILLCFLAPFATSFGYLLLRDSPKLSYNYLDTYNINDRSLPHPSEGRPARVGRAWQHFRAAQFQDMIAFDLVHLCMQCRWMITALSPTSMWLTASYVICMTVGSLHVARQCREVLWVLAGPCIASVAFALTVRGRGVVCDLMPAIWICSVLIAIGVTRVVNRMTPRVTQILGMSTLVAASLFATTIAEPAKHRRSAVDAVPFVQLVDLDTLPDESLICVGWPLATPLWYAQKVIGAGPDIPIVTGGEDRCLEIAREFGAQWVFFSDRPQSVEQENIVLIRGLWRFPTTYKPTPPATTNP
jgi:hypothetical protein